MRRTMSANWTLAASDRNIYGAADGLNSRCPKRPFATDSNGSKVVLANDSSRAMSCRSPITSASTNCLLNRLVDTQENSDAGPATSTRSLMAPAAKLCPSANAINNRGLIRTNLLRHWTGRARMADDFYLHCTSTRLSFLAISFKPTSGISDSN
jgi:hypothetical protein